MKFDYVEHSLDLGAFIRPPLPLFCAKAFAEAYKKSSVQAGARFASIEVYPINRTLK